MARQQKTADTLKSPLPGGRWEEFTSGKTGRCTKCLTELPPGTTLHAHIVSPEPHRNKVYCGECQKTLQKSTK